MNDSKAWYSSKTVWASIVGGLVTILGMFHINIADMAPQIVDNIMGGVAIGSFALALYGRVTATAKIGQPQPVNRMGGMIRALLVAAILPALLFVNGCKSTGNIGTDVQSFWNSPTVQTELSTLQSEALNFLNAFITAHVGVSKTSTSARVAAIAHLRANHPEIPDTVIVGAVDKAASK